MFNLARFVLLLLLAATSGRAASSLEHARRAQALLGSDVWSQVLRIENASRGGRYPHTVHALVFELAGLLWFYTDSNGTQSFSLHRDRVAEEKADFAPLLHDIEPGFARWSVVTGPPPRISHPRPPLPNACFIESVAALRARLTANAPARNARLLSYYTGTRTGTNGHTVLAYENGNVVEILDPAQPGRVFRFPLADSTDPLALARHIEGPEVARARVLALNPVGSTAIAAATRASGNKSEVPM
ncbi:MAG TPA: hypothetical protein VM029_11525 [Opitutaceae bacterium]|nr:hypothetical protein [Opitutaceae bacterium]